MSLRFTPEILRRIHEHLASAYPEEGCGVLLGREVGESRQVVETRTFENQRPDSRHNRYLISPEQLLAADRDARGKELDVIGFYHSHPDHPARPSEFDRENAWPWYSYVIVSVAGGRPVETTSWRLADDRSRFVPEALVSAPGPPNPAAAENAR